MPKEYTVTTDENGLVKDFQFMPDNKQHFYDSERFIRKFSVSGWYAYNGEDAEKETDYLEPNSKYRIVVNPDTRPFYKVLAKL